MNKTEFIRRFHHIERVRSELDYPLAYSGRPAAVLVPLIDYKTELKVLLTERAHHLRHHAGQISFPGGGAEAEDTFPVGTALREAEEEIGLPPEHVQIMGALPNYRTISGYTIKPVIGIVKPDCELSLDKNEVASAFEVPLSYLMNRANHLTHHTHRHGQTFPIYFIPWNKHMIWGATAALLRNLSFHLLAEND
ncbi:CoA pyrophosphatase [Alteromonas sp. ASW11-130]|uniref:CoA pyrophosphatase n=1 Tax=Alteromonas sp. ASW11-130 TaxID=3015775 RepID=UPI0022422CD4|nr:CoA pyrophosphatase [Alteromonas sp. ASW11-130]MCW8092271.1 CoA pyrophosphatase [Alteromonas sp. ASW11-130]